MSNELTLEQKEKIEKIIVKHKEEKGNLIPTLHEVQKIFGYLPKEAQKLVAFGLDVPVAEVYGVVTFYSLFNTEPAGEYIIELCMGTACFVRGSNKIFDKLKELLNVQSGETTEDKLFTLKDVRCVGACGLAPIVMVDDKVYGRVKLEDLEGILDEYRGGE